MRALLCLLLAGIALPIPATELSLPHTGVRFLHSAANGVRYELYVSVPREYEGSKSAYPVLYLLDADYSFPIVRGIVEHLGDRNRLRPMIVVGIAYAGPNRYRLNRTRDYTPRQVPTGGYGPEVQKVSGGGPKFLQFIRKELIPWVDRNYRTTGERGLVGHSFGGLFANWVLLTAPSTFSRYVIVSPSLWYGDRFAFDLEAKADRNAVPAGTKVYMAVGSREGNAQRRMVPDLEQMAEALGGWSALAVKSDVLRDETHDSVFPNAVSRGIRFVFGGD